MRGIIGIIVLLCLLNDQMLLTAMHVYGHSG